MKARQEAAERRRLEVQKAKRQKSEARGGNQISETQTLLSGEAEVKVPRTAVEAGESTSAGGGR